MTKMKALFTLTFALLSMSFLYPFASAAKVTEHPTDISGIEEHGATKTFTDWLYKGLL